MLLSPRLLSSLAAALAAPAVAQVANEFDFDPRQLPPTTISPNGPVHVISTNTTWAGQNLVLNVPLTIAANAELRVERATLMVHGDVTLHDGGRLTVVDASLLLPNQFQRQHEFRIEGGVVHTERATIGSTHVLGNVLHATRLHLLRGTWLARETVVQALVTILSYGRTGWEGNPLHKGGSVFADGLYEGDRADALHMSGLGDASLANGTMNVALYYDAGVATQPVAATLDLDRRNRLTLVYGAPGVHTGVTFPIQGHLNRLALQHHRVPSWQLFAINASSSAQTNTLTLRNAEDVSCSFQGTNLVGSPALGGPWGTYYSVLPGLPSTSRPGHHAMPPGCSVRLGNVTFVSGPSDWNRIRFWGLYAHGSGTNLTVTGPTAFAELQVRNGGQVHLIGTKSFDMGVLCETVRVFDASSLHLTNVALGAFDTGGTSRGLLEANDSSTCTIDTARSSLLRLRATSPSASITATNLLGVENLLVDNPGGGTIHVGQAAPGQNTDLQNLGFESAPVGSVPPYWTAQGLTATAATDVAPGAGGTRSVTLAAQAVNGTLQKRLTLPPETFVSVIGAAKVLQAPGGGAPLRLQVANGANVQAAPLAPAPLGTWQRVHVPLLTVGTATPLTTMEFVAGGLPATVRLDDVRVQVGSWWEADNLANLGFEWGCRYQGLAPTYWSAPDAWQSYQVHGESDASIVRPAAAAGSRSIRLTLQGPDGSLYKDLTFLRPGDTMVVTGWARGVGGGLMRANIGDGATFAIVGFGPNVLTPPLPCDGTWRQFQLTYVPPSNPTYTRLYLGCYASAGVQCWWDDLTVEIQ